MNRLTKYFTGAIIAFSLTTTAIHAENVFTPPAEKSEKSDARKDRPKDRNRTEFLTKKLNLTEEQQQQFKLIMASAKPKLEAIQEEARQKTELVQNEINASLNQILTPEQQQTYAEIQQKRKEFRSKRKQSED